MAEKRYTYAVLWGMRCVKGFRKLKIARKYAKEKARKIKRPTEIDKITSYYPPITMFDGGKTDWSQGFYETILPSGKIVKKELTPEKLGKVI